jgi:hypothetical protein
MNWQTFCEKLLPKIIKLAGFGRAAASRNAAAEMITAATIFAAEKNALEENLLHTFLDLSQDSDRNICKTTLGALKLLFRKLEPAKIEKIFLNEVFLNHLQ